MIRSGCVTKLQANRNPSPNPHHVNIPTPYPPIVPVGVETDKGWSDLEPEERWHIVQEPYSSTALPLYLLTPKPVFLHPALMPVYPCSRIPDPNAHVGMLCRSSLRMVQCG